MLTHYKYRSSFKILKTKVKFEQMPNDVEIQDEKSSMFDSFQVRRQKLI